MPDQGSALSTPMPVATDDPSRKAERICLPLASAVRGCCLVRLNFGVEFFPPPRSLAFKLLPEECGARGQLRTVEDRPLLPQGDHSLNQEVGCRWNIENIVRRQNDPSSTRSIGVNSGSTPPAVLADLYSRVAPLVAGIAAQYHERGWIADRLFFNRIRSASERIRCGGGDAKICPAPAIPPPQPTTSFWV